MANGPFGNPLSTGIALSGVIDMVTPVRQAQERKRKRQAEEKVEQDNRAKELGAIMGKIAIDEDKIWWRYHDDARLQYAGTIDKVQQMYSAGDYAGMYKTINQFDTKMANYIQATNQKNARVEELKKGGYYMDSNLESMRENRDVDNTEYAKYLQETGYGTLGQEGIFSYMPNAKMFDIKDAWERNVKGEEKLLITEPGKGYKQVGTTPTGVIAETDYAPEILSTAQQRILSELYADPYRAARILEKEGYDVKSLESIADPQQKAIRTKEMFDDYIMRNKPGFGEQMLGKWQPRVDKTGYTRPGVMGKVQIAEAQTTPISREAFNINEYKSGAQPVIESKVLDILKQQGSNNEKGVKTELENLLQKLVIVEDVNDYFSNANLISVAVAVGEDIYGTPVEIDLNDQAAAAKKIAEVLSGASDENLKSIGNNIGFEYAAPSSVIKDFEKTAQVSTFGGDVRKSYEMPKGEIYMVGSKGAQVVKIRNGINVAGSLFKSFNRDKDGEIWHGIDFPVEEQSAITSLLEQALGRESIDDFIKSNGIPKTFYVPETQKNVATFLTTDSQGKLTPEFLDAELKKIGVYGSGTQSSESSGEVEVDEFGFPIEN